MFINLMENKDQNKEIEKIKNTNNSDEENKLTTYNKNIENFTHLNPLDAQKMAHTYSLLIDKKNYKRKGTFFEK